MCGWLVQRSGAIYGTVESQAEQYAQLTPGMPLLAHSGLHFGDTLDTTLVEHQQLYPPLTSRSTDHF